MTSQPDVESVQEPPPGCPAHAGSPYRAELFGPAFASDPGAVYERLRRLGPTAPVSLSPAVEATLVTSYDAALELLRSPETYSKDARRWRGLADGRVAQDDPVVPIMVWRPNCLYADGAEHVRLRQAVTDSLSRIDPNALRGYVERSVDGLIDKFGPDGEADLLADYASVLPLLVFIQLFGCPPEHGNRLVACVAALFDGVDADKANTDLYTCISDIVALKRAQPGADVTSWLMAHPSQLTDEEMIHQLIVVMGAGTDPQKNLIANGLRLLLSDDRFAGSLSGGSLPVENALDEVLWTDPPLANFGVHFPVRDVDFHGARLREGEPVLISFGAANTDPSLASEQRAGNRAHLAWSAGPHACPAQSASRLIASVAIEKLLDRLPDIELAKPVDELSWRPGPFHRALVSLPVRFPSIRPSVTTDETSGDSRWSPSPAPSSSTLPAVTSTAKPKGSGGKGPRRVWNYLVAWWRGQ